MSNDIDASPQHIGTPGAQTPPARPPTASHVAPAPAIPPAPPMPPAPSLRVAPDRTRARPARAPSRSPGPARAPERKRDPGPEHGGPFDGLRDRDRARDRQHRRGRRGRRQARPDRGRDGARAADPGHGVHRLFHAHGRTGSPAHEPAPRPHGRRPHPARVRAGPRQDDRGEHSGRHGQGRLQADPVHARPAAERHHRHPDLRRGQRHLPHRAGPGACELRSARRDQPLQRQDPERHARGHAGAADHDRRRDLPGARGRSS